MPSKICVLATTKYHTVIAEYDEYRSTGKVFNPAHGHLNRENVLRPVPFRVFCNMASKDMFGRRVPGQPAYYQHSG